MSWVLVSKNYGGNLHATVQTINMQGLAEYVLVMESPSGFNTIVVFRVPQEMAATVEAL